MPKCSEFKCRKCGECCGAVPISRDERNKIRIYLLKHPEIAEFANEKPFSEKCVFRNDAEGKCMIYECRPKVCRLFKCDGSNWYKDLKGVKFRGGDVVLINERFGNPKFRERYRDLMERMVSEEASAMMMKMHQALLLALLSQMFFESKMKGE